jgi:hypothetical protein
MSAIDLTATLDDRHEEEAVHGGRRVGEEISAGQALMGSVFRLAGLKDGLSLLRRVESLELIDVVDDLAELSDEKSLFLRGETEPGQRSDFPYFFEV